jgi:hypothetical protein
MVTGVREAMTAENDGKVARKRIRRPVVLLAILVVLLAAWCAYWFAAYRMAESFIPSAAAAEQTGSAPAIACADRALGGFPLQLTIRCNAGSAATADGVRATLGPFAATAPLYAPGRVVAGLSGPLQVDGPGFALTAGWTRADVTADAGLIGTVAGAANLEGLFVDVTTNGVPLFSAQATVWGTEVRPATEADALRVVVNTDDFVLTLDGAAYPQLSGTASLTLLGAGERLDRDPMGILSDWLSSGGNVRVEHAALSSGTVNADVRGDLKLELDGTLSGSLAVLYSGEEDLPLLVAAIFPWAGNQADVVAEAIVAVSRPIELMGAPALEVHLMLDHGVVKYGLFPILTIPSMGSLAHLL